MLGWYGSHSQDASSEQAPGGEPEDEDVDEPARKDFYESVTRKALVQTECPRSGPK